jgi:hypothetical protein
VEVEKKTASLVAVVIAVAVAMVGCGGGGSSSSTESATTSTPAKTTAAKKAPSEKSNASEPSAEFAGKGPNGKLAKVGKEASVAEREAASKVLEESFDARAAGKWAAQCATLAAALVTQIEKSGALLTAAGGCPKVLETQAGPLPESARANNMAGPVAALRVKGGINGFAFYHGTDGKDYVIPLIKQGGEWKVVALTAQKAP